MSAIREEGADAEPIRVLFTLHPNMNALDFVGPLEVLSQALNDVSNEEDKAFDCEFVGPGEHVMSASGTSFRSHLTYKDAYKQLKEYDLLVVAGGNFEEIIKNKEEPLGLIRAFADLQEHNAGKERTIFSIDTGSILLAHEGILQGLAATTHPTYYINLEITAQESAQKDLDTRTEVIEGERYVVNQGRFDLGDNLDDNPYVFKKNPGRNFKDDLSGDENHKVSKRRASLPPMHDDQDAAVPSVIKSKDDQNGNENYKFNKRRASLPAKHDEQDVGITNETKVPSYMAATESAKAKARGQVSPRFGQDAYEKNGLPRRYSLPSSTNVKLTSSPRVQSLVQGSGKGGIKIDRSLSSSRDGNI